jgi:hypothetical protein
MGWIIGFITIFFVALNKKSVKHEVINYNTDYWVPLFNQMRGDIPLPFIYTWAKIESDGNPCATGGGIASNGKTLESGLAQLFYPSDYNKLGINIDEFRSYCKGGSSGASQVCIRRLTSSEEKEQVKALVDKINDSRSIITSLGINWLKSSKDYWYLVKLRHGMPEILRRGWLEGGKPKNWQEFKLAVNRLNISTGWIPHYKDKDGNTIYYSQASINHVINNAQKVGDAIQPPKPNA